MGIMMDAMKKAAVAQVKCEKCGKVLRPEEPQHTVCDDCYPKEQPAHEGKQEQEGAGDFAPDYPDYFDEQNVLKCVYVTSGAKYIAERLRHQKYPEPQMTMHQLRAFYQHVRLQEDALKNKCPFREVRKELCALEPIASERAAKGKIPHYFESFILRNVDKVTANADDAEAFKHAFLKGFVEHFQAVVAYAAGTIKER